MQARGAAGVTRGTSEWPSAGLEPGTVREPSRPLLAAVPALWGKVTAAALGSGPRRRSPGRAGSRLPPVLLVAKPR